MRGGAFLTGLLAVVLTGLNVCGSAHGEPLKPLATFTDGVAFSADAVPGFFGGNLRVDTTAANILPSPNTQDVTVKAAYLYNVTVVGSSPLTTLASLNGNMVTLGLLEGTDHAGLNLQTYRADVTPIVSPLINGKPGITALPASLISTSPESNGLALVVVFASPGLDPSQSVAIVDGGQSGPTSRDTTFGLANPLGKSFNAVLSLGISFGQQGGGGPHFCGTASLTQFSVVDVNDGTLTSCAGGSDDGDFITVGGVGDSTDNPSDPFCQAGPPPPGKPACSTTDDELYNISSFLKPGDTQVKLTVSNTSSMTPSLGDDSIFLAILQVTGTILVCEGVNCPPPPPSPVPGPATLILLGTGLLALIAASRLFRRR